MRIIQIVLFLTCCSGLISAAPFLNNGQNIVKPINRLDLRMKYETGVTKHEGDAAIPTFRHDHVMDIGDQWLCAYRLDISYWWYRCMSNSQDNCYNSQALGDTLFQVLIVPPTWDLWTIAFGFKFMFPTAGNNLEIGDAVYQIMPTYAVGYDLPWIGPSSFCGLLVRHAFDVGGFHGAPRLNRTYIQPTLNVDLPARWFLTFSPELCYNWEVSGWFIPFDVTLGRMVTERLIMTLEYEVALMRVYKEYKQLVEFRVGFFF